ncbi:MAG: sulfatase [Phycisphaerales bacterium]|nr:sulfatase [Phycisphaerales bacterium]
MKCIVVMFDSLNRRMLPGYGCDWTHTPNFRRLAERTVQFNRAYVGSMPCMPCRREMHTGRPNFLHRSWGPLEPFDDSMPEMLKKAGIYSHLATDHQHYFEDGGCTYHTRFSSWEFFRGQEGDPCHGVVKLPKPPEVAVERGGPFVARDWVNRSFIKTESDFPQAKTFAAGLKFIEQNHADDNWFLQIETFDPHEPFFADDKYRDLYAKHHDEYKGKRFDWPPYRKVQETPEEVEHCRYEYMALLSMCDAYLGKVLHAMDKYDLWKDTMLIVCTDHGFMLGEHECWAKIWMPFYQEVANVPLYIWDPRSGKRGETRESLVQTIDYVPTILEFFGQPLTKDMLGKVLKDTIANDTPVREACIFGVHGGQVNVTDGHYVYMRSPVKPEDQPLYQYTLMPTHMHSLFAPQEFKDVEMAVPFSFTKGCKLMRMKSHLGKRGWEHPDRFKTQLWDVQNDPNQVSPLTDEKIENQMITHMIRLMKECDAPAEQYERLGLI